MNTKTIIFFATLLIVGMAWVSYTNNTLDPQKNEAYENCEPMVDIDGNPQMVCKD